MNLEKRRANKRWQRVRRSMVLHIGVLKRRHKIPDEVAEALRAAIYKADASLKQTDFAGCCVKERKRKCTCSVSDTIALIIERGQDEWPYVRDTIVDQLYALEGTQTIPAAIAESLRRTIGTVDASLNTRGQIAIARGNDD